ncbi:peptidyl-prolyl isomerase cwc27 [Fimicolochytrium jonesii]|uniref:peptidyl-prolyl isomerase cwc27 n=1 Tax=Fimicolochytrium jonesii TaxID=1396493 RepID=UPI0022FE1B3B|nr:peptidyl-prolyl isomerase cwc27 [Fimicolochytrium jonesii]KAI8823952.1 peptidyl-prolyl isomerase cwc27 [Fimicolochytrium jonesii]
MSNAYITAPPTNGKVILHTTAGPLEIELWPKETPKACRNFIQLCMEGYYDNTIFHRVVKDFIVQGGDPSGTGHGGESIYGEPFVDEFHSRLRFSHRGLLGMANTGVNENSSQFFFTLDRADELNRKNTLFGKIVGDTIYNLIKFADLETDGDDRPLFPPKVIRAEVLNNPFEDIELRTTPEEKIAAAAAEMERRKREEAARKPKGKKNLKLLSFGEEEGEGEVGVTTAPKTKLKSSHDLREVAVDTSKLESETATADSTFDGGKQPTSTKSSTNSSLRASMNIPAEEDDAAFDTRMRESVPPTSTTTSSTASHPTKLETLQSEIAKVRGEIRSIGKDEDSHNTTGEKKPKKEKLLQSFRAAYEQSGKAVPVASRRKRGKGEGERDTLDLLSRFQETLRASAKVENRSSRGDDTATTTLPTSSESQECDLHFVTNCESCRPTLTDPTTTTTSTQEDDEKNWMSTTLVFPKHVKGANVYEPTIEDYTVEDPRNGAKGIDLSGRRGRGMSNSGDGGRNGGYRDQRGDEGWRGRGEREREGGYRRR